MRDLHLKRYLELLSPLTSLSLKGLGVLVSLIIAASRFRLIGFSWLFMSLVGALLVSALPKKTWLLPLFWLIGTLLDLGGGTALGLGGLYFLGQMLGLELKFIRLYPVTWLIITSFGWLMMNY